jgi:hypothetical protein
MYMGSTDVRTGVPKPLSWNRVELSAQSGIVCRVFRNGDSNEKDRTRNVAGPWGCAAHDAGLGVACERADFDAVAQCYPVGPVLLWRAELLLV